MKYATKRKMVEARRAFRSGDWAKGDKLVSEAEMLDSAPDLSYQDLRALARLRRSRRAITLGIGRTLERFTTKGTA